MIADKYYVDRLRAEVERLRAELRNCAGVVHAERARASLWGMGGEFDRVKDQHARLRAAAQAVVAVADGDMNRELLDAIDAFDAELEGSTKKQ